jgi:hypothetical protein
MKIQGTLEVNTIEKISDHIEDYDEDLSSSELRFEKREKKSPVRREGSPPFMQSKRVSHLWPNSQVMTKRGPSVIQRYQKQKDFDTDR